MADSSKQVLRDFQSRLADRLRSAQAGAGMASWLAVRAGGQGLLVPLSHAAEIFSWTDVQPVPHARPWFLGVANLRGNLLGVVDLGLFLAQPDAAAGPAPARSPQALMQSRLISLNPVLEVNSALLVDELLGMRTTESFARSDAPDAEAPGFFGHLYTDLQGELWQEINLQSLAQQGAFIDIGASTSITEPSPDPAGSGDMH